MSLRVRTGSLLLSFLLLVSISVAATAWIVNDQAKDARAINLAGRQRMLIQQVARETLEIEQGENQAAHVQVLNEAVSTFDQTLHALQSGGQAPYLPGRSVSISATRQGDIRDALWQINQAWNTFRADLDVIRRAPPDSAEFVEARQHVEQLSPELAQQADRIVQLYEADSERKIARLRWIQAGFFAGAIGLLVAGVILIRRQIMIPLYSLRRAAERIGQGNLSDPVSMAHPPEFAALAHSFDAMRQQLTIAAGELETRVEQRTRELTALYDVIREISSHLEIDRVLESVTAKARDLLNSEVAFLCLLDEAGQRLTLRAYQGPPESVCGTCVLVHQSVAQQVLAHDQAMICDVGACGNIAPAYRSSHLAAPLRTGERVIGALCVGTSRAATYSQDQVRLLTELANSTTIALENARLYHQAELIATLEERQRIAAEMHDGLAQTLSYLQLKTGQLAALIAAGDSPQAAGELQQIDQAIERAGAEVRRAIANWQTEAPPDVTLQTRLTELVAAFSQSGGPRVEFVGANSTPLILSPDAAAQVMRVVQEALQNARRHAQAQHIWLGLERGASGGQITVQDDGCGFDLGRLNTNGHFGLTLMRARAARLGGAIEIQTAYGQGTTVTLSWPGPRQPEKDGHDGNHARPAS